MAGWHVCTANCVLLCLSAAAAVAGDVHCDSEQTMQRTRGVTSPQTCSRAVLDSRKTLKLKLAGGRRSVCVIMHIHKWCVWNVIPVLYFYIFLSALASNKPLRYYLFLMPALCVPRGSNFTMTNTSHSAQAAPTVCSRCDRCVWEMHGNVTDINSTI